MGALLVLGIGAAVVSAAIPDADGYTYTCVNNSSGIMMAREKGASCPKNSTASRLVANQNAVNLSTYRKDESFLIAAGATGGKTVNCDAGDLATGGGFSSAASGDLIPDASVPVPFNPPTTGWIFTATNTDTVGRSAEVWVACLHIS
jgi:hypothetical protein